MIATESDDELPNLAARIILTAWELVVHTIQIAKLYFLFLQNKKIYSKQISASLLLNLRIPAYYSFELLSRLDTIPLCDVKHFVE